jgi:quinone-modifying oxidoreductase subunit QmoB
VVKESKNTGVYICSGCNIGDAIDTDKLQSIAIEYPSVKQCQVHPVLCSPEAYLKLNDEINEQQLDSLIIAGCSPRHAPDSLIFSEIHCESVNLREGVAWVMEAGHEDTQAAAEDYLRMGIARTAASGLPEPYIHDAPESDILILGGGITGIHSALEGARAGYSVVLVEKEDKLGGRLNDLHDIIPVSGSKQTNLNYFLEEKLDELAASALITVHKNTSLESIEGEPGKFLAKLRNGTGSSECKVGSVILANGWKPYDPAKLTNLGYTDHKNIITQTELETMQKEDRILRPSDGNVPSTIVFIQCAGSREKDHLPYCSNVCCLTSLKQVSYIRQKYPESKIFIIYKDIRTPGKNEHIYREVQKDNHVFFTK